MFDLTPHLSRIDERMTPQQYAAWVYAIRLTWKHALKHVA